MDWLVSLTVGRASNSEMSDVGEWIISVGNMCGLVGNRQHGLRQKQTRQDGTYCPPKRSAPPHPTSQNHNMQIEKIDFHEAGSEDNKNKWSLETSEREPSAFIVGI